VNASTLIGDRTIRRIADLRHRPFSIDGPTDGRSYDLVVCGVFRNDARHLREWIEFHRLVGADKFVLFDNHSVDDYLSVLRPYVESGIVSLHHLPRVRASYPFYRALQLRAYDACVERYRDRARWIACIDPDEFLNPQDRDSIVDLLADYEEHPALAVHWVMFATSGHVLRPDALVLDAYTACAAGGNHRVKVIVDPRRTRRFLSPHHAEYVAGATAVNELGVAVADGESRPPTVSRIRVNHYYTRSVEDFLAKYVANDGRRTGHKGLVELPHAEREYSSDVDTSIQRFLPRLRTALATEVV
jgi:hypothetical protein